MVAVNYDWDEIEDNIDEEHDDSGNTIAEYTTEPYLYGDLISQWRNGDSRFYCFDGQGSTLALTDSAGIVTGAYAYTAYGCLVELSGLTVSTVRYIGQQGYYSDIASSQVIVRRRTLAPSIERWHSIDPARTWEESNGYLYSRNSPTTYADPSGLQAVTKGTATCIKPLGLVYIAGRGNFIGTQVGQFDPKDEGVFGGWNAYLFPRIGSSFGTEWRPDPSAFVTPSGCCCCDVVGLVQVFAETVKYPASTPTPPDHPFESMPTAWTVDKGIPYPNPMTGNRGNPCKGKKVLADDAPNAPARYRGVGNSLALLKQHFWTCAVCLGGVEGPTIQLKSWFSSVTNYISMAVYGCLHWGHVIYYRPTPPGYVYHRFIFDNEAPTHTENAVVNVVKHPGVAPPPEWWKAVQEHDLPPPIYYM